MLITLFAVAFTFNMRADGQIIPISDDAVLFIQIALVILCIGAVFGLTALLRRLVRNRNLPEPRSYLLIVVVTLSLAAFWYWIADEKNLLRGSAELLITPITLLIVLFVPVVLYRISPKKDFKG